MIDFAQSQRQYCTFRLAQYHCGIDVLAVREILRYQPMTRVPLAPPVVKGLLNLRGQIITAIDARTRLGLPPREGERKPVNIVVAAGDSGEESLASLLVDEIGDVVSVDAASCEPPPETAPPNLREVLVAVCKREQGLLLLFDAARLIRISASATA
ncbi:MAG: chemotaxis protein CheW [Planctomycetota bacterium]|nr:chemotaxis protein CheW [Planctomycetota bacterium]MCX8040764.1 chemotaxis protein CheW [Planctomycetota bacterium]MDW8373714.1 chemotaxis protein CheW [Planctomycetota bacterium]